MKKRAGFFARLKRGFNVVVGGGESGGGWAASAINRLLMDWVSRGITSESDLTSDLVTLRNRARELAGNNAYASAYLNLVSVNVVGPTGFSLSAKVRALDGKLDKDKNHIIEEGWYSWADKPVTRDERLDFVSLQHLLIRSVARDGEAFVRIWVDPDATHGILLEPIDATLIDESKNMSGKNGEPVIKAGIEMNAFGKPVAYWVRDPEKSISARVNADEIIHLYRSHVASQVRGVSWLAPAMITLQHIRGYVEAELVAARAGSAKMGFFVNKDGTGALDPSVGGDKEINMEASPGSMEILPPGYSFEQWNPDHPSAAFPSFIKTALREVATGWHVSYNALANDLEGVNYSSMRSGMLIERDVWKTLQQWWIPTFLNRVYKAWLMSSALKGTLKLKPVELDLYLPCKWTPRGWSWVDPLKDVQAGILMIENHLASHGQLLEEQGLGYEEVLEQLKLEQDMAKEAGLKIEKADPNKGPSKAPKDPDEKDPEDNEDGEDHEAEED